MTGRAAAWACGGVGLLAMAVLALFDRTAALQGWLAAAMGATCIAVGALALLLAGPLLPEPWTARTGAGLAMLVLTLPLAALAFLPVLMDLPALYAWADARSWQEGWARESYLEPTGFVLRTAVVFALWIVLALLGRQARPAVGAAGLIILTLSFSVAAVDWVMSLEPAFRSSMFGLLMLSDALLSGLAAAILLTPERSLGGLLLAGVMLWAYLAFMQYLVVWSADLPPEALWYLHREKGGWGWVAAALGLLLGAVPFLALLPASVRADPGRLRAVAALVLAMRQVETVWLVLPSFGGPQPLPLLAAGLATLALGGLGLGVVLSLRRRTAESAHG
jgi:hypothetical protein